MTQSMTKLTQDSLFQFLKKNKLEPTLQKESGQIYIVASIANQDVPIFFGIRRDGLILQIIAYLPFEIRPQSVPEVARLLHYLNKELDIPGFGMDEPHELLFYRTIVPCKRAEFDEELFDIYLSTLKVACDTFMGAIAMIGSGASSFEEAIQKMKEKNQ